MTIDSNVTIHVTVTDRSQKSGADSFGLTARAADGSLWLSTKWTGVQTAEELLQTGHINVK